MKKKYKLEVDTVEHGRYYIYEHTEHTIRCAIIVYNDFDLAKRIFDVLVKENN